MILVLEPALDYNFIDLQNIFVWKLFYFDCVIFYLMV